MQAANCSRSLVQLFALEGDAGLLLIPVTTTYVAQGRRPLTPLQVAGFMTCISEGHGQLITRLVAAADMAYRVWRGAI